MIHFLRLAAFSGLVFLAACAPRGAITVFPDAESVGKVLQVFVGTTRDVDDSGNFTNHRAYDVTYLRHDISIPPKHKSGNIEWPIGRADPQKHFLTIDRKAFAGASSFRADLAKALRIRPAGQREVVIYVHGFNNNFAEGLYRLAQLSNDMGLPSPTVHYSWPSTANVFGYAYDRDSLLFARDGFEEMMRTVTSAGADRILIIGHSLGALLTMETLRQIAISDDRSLMRRISGVVLISPDIDVDLFRKQAARIGPLPQPFIIFTSQKDRALRLSARLAGRHERLGTVADVRKLPGLRVSLVDVTAFSKGATGHFNTATSPELIKILNRLRGVESAFRNDRAGRSGLLPGTILTVQQATQIILLPASVLAN